MLEAKSSRTSLVNVWMLEMMTYNLMSLVNTHSSLGLVKPPTLVLKLEDASERRSQVWPHRLIWTMATSLLTNLTRHY